MEQWLVPALYALIHVGGITGFAVRHRGAYRARLGIWAFALFLTGQLGFVLWAVLGAQIAVFRVLSALSATGFILLVFTFLRWDTGAGGYTPSGTEGDLMPTCLCWGALGALCLKGQLLLIGHSALALALVITGVMVVWRHFRGPVAVGAAVAGLSAILLAHLTWLVPQTRAFYDWALAQAPPGPWQTVDPHSALFLLPALGWAALVIAIWAAGGPRGR